MQDIAKSFSHEPSGKLKLFSPVTFGEYFIVPSLKEFTHRYPKVVIELDLADRVPDGAAESIDLCLGLQSHWEHTLKQKKLCVMRHCLVASPLYIEKHGILKTWGDLVYHRFIVHSKRPDLFMFMFEDGDLLSINASMFANNTHALLQCAVDGLGIISVYDYISWKLIHEGKLKPILDSDPLKSAIGYAFYSPTYHFKPATRAFLDHLSVKLKDGYH